MLSCACFCHVEIRWHHLGVIHHPCASSAYALDAWLRAYFVPECPLCTTACNVESIGNRSYNAGHSLFFKNFLFDTVNPLLSGSPFKVCPYLTCILKSLSIFFFCLEILDLKGPLFKVIFNLKYKKGGPMT